MIDATALVQDLRVLLDDCSVVDGLDEAVEHKSNTGKRIATVEALIKIVQLLNENYRRLALAPILKDSYLVHSQFNASGTANINLISDTSIRKGSERDGGHWAAIVDSAIDRYTYYSEFVQRGTRLREQVLMGNLDSILGLHPTNILHGISGLNGEFLKAIDWDPFNGETYTRFSNDPMLKALNDYEASKIEFGQIWENRAKNIKNIFNAAFEAANNPLANAKQANISSSTVGSQTKTATPRIRGVYSFDERLGLSYTGLKYSHRIAMNLPSEISGVLVIRVEKGSPAFVAGIKGFKRTEIQGDNTLLIGGDIITEINRNKIASSQEFEKWLETMPAQSILKVYRSGEMIEIPIQ